MDKIIKPSTQKIIKTFYTSFIPGFKKQTKVIEDPKRYQQKMHRITITNEVTTKLCIMLMVKKLRIVSGVKIN